MNAPTFPHAPDIEKARSAPRPPPVPKCFRAGTHRLVTPEETVERVRPLMPVLGITRIADVTGLDTIGLPVTMVCRPNARSLSISPGKGTSLAAARASGLMESVEAHHAEHVHLPLVLGTRNELRHSHPLAEVDQLPRVSVGNFHDDLPIPWIPGIDVMAGAPAWVPYEVVHLNFARPLPPGSGSFLMGSGGLASGNHILEAVSHGICELVEHDATTLWRLSTEGDRRRTRLDLASVDDDRCRQVLDRYDRAGVDVMVWETTSDIRIPTFRCAIAERSPSPERPVHPASGLGCHPSREIALLRALTEAAQSRLTLIVGARDDVHRESYQTPAAMDALSRFRKAFEYDTPLRHFTDVPTFESETLDEDVAWELDRLREGGIFHVIVVDLTKPEYGIPVARVVIPGLEPLDDVPGYVPGFRAQRRLEERAS